jgi:acyl-CoA synthetase (AMP-forming)/AMP-acid ligase II
MTKHMIADQDHEGRLLQHILRHGSERPDADALICGDVTLGWGELRSRVLRLAGAVHSNLGPGAGRVALIGDVSADLVVAYLAVVAAGKCAVPLQTSLQPDALTGMLGNCEPAAVFAAPAFLDQVAGALGPEISVVGLDDGSLQCFEADSRPLDDAIAANPETPFNIIYSSGTTGRPKGIVQSHAMRYRQAARGLFGLTPQSTMLLATPLYSNTTLMPMITTLVHGGRVVMMPKFDAEAYLDLAERFGATHTMLVPVQYRRIMDAASFARRDLSRFEVKQSTGAPLSADDKRRVAEHWPGRFLEIYGLTEGGCTCVLDVTQYPEKLHTVGQPSQNNDIRVIDEDGRDLKPGERGEIIGRSPMMMSGYFRNPEATEAFLWRDADGTIYHRTGDIGVFDDDGFLTLVDRKKDVIISGGFNVYASDLEDVLHSNPMVAEAAVIGIPSASWGETPLGLVVARSGATLSPAELLDWANARLGKMQRLSAIEVRSGLPRSAVGKVLKQDLKRPYWENNQ